MQKKTLLTPPVPSDILRPDRFEVQDAILELHIKTFKLSVKDYSSFGLGALGPITIAIDANNLEGELIGYHSLTKQVQSFGIFSFRVVRQKKLDTFIELGLEVLSNTLPIRSIQSYFFKNSFEQHIEQLTVHYDAAPKTFHHMTHYLCFYLWNFQKWCQSLEEHLNKMFPLIQDQMELQEFEEHLTLNMVGLLDKIFSNITSQVLTQETWNEILKVSSLQVLTEVFHLFFNPFRLKSKGLMTYENPMNLIAQLENWSMGQKLPYLGEDLFSKILAGYLLQHPQSKMIFDRSFALFFLLKEQIEQFHQEKPKEVFKILSFSCGPAKEIMMLLEEIYAQKQHSASISIGSNPFQLEVTLCDFNRASLKNTQKTLRDFCAAHKLQLKIQYIPIEKEIDFNFFLNNNAFDIIYSLNSLDTMSNDKAYYWIKLLTTGLSKEGRIILGSHEPSAWDAFLHQLALTPNFCGRTWQDIQALLHEIEHFSIELQQDSGSSNSFVIMQRKPLA